MFWEDWAFTKLVKGGIMWYLDYITLGNNPSKDYTN